MLGQLDLNPVLSAIKLTPDDRIISIREIGIADSNFVLTHLLKKIFNNNEKLCFVTFHNPLSHYQIVGKKLGYDLSNKISNGDAVILDMLQKIQEIITSDNFDFLQDNDAFVKKLYEDIELKTEQLSKFNRQIYVVIDDISHLLDLGIGVEYVMRFITWCCNLKSDTISVIINNHVSPFDSEADFLPRDIILSNSLSYISDLDIEVSPLKTGRSNEISGIISIIRPGQFVNKLHYKAYDRGIKTFKPGDF